MENKNKRAVQDISAQLREKQAAIMRYGTEAMKAGWTDAKVEAAIEAARRS